MFLASVTDSMIEAHHQLAWRLNILIEEIQGLEMCTISVHNLVHIHEDIIRFSATDNYWCAVFERAVKGYTKRASNCRGIEKTFALAESRREFLKPYSQAQIERGKLDKKVGIASSLDAAKMAANRGDCLHRSFLLGALDNMALLEEVDREKVADTMSTSLHHIPHFVFISKKCFMADKGFGGTVCYCGDTVVVLIAQEEYIMKVDKFVSVKDNNESYKLLIKGYLYNNVYADNGQPLKHFWSGFTYVKSNPQSDPVFCAVNNIQRKVILYGSTEASNLTVIDYQRRREDLPFDLIVPIYPEKEDMLLVQGEDVGDIWYGHVRNVNYTDKTVDVYFFVESPRMPNIFVRESTGRGARNTVPWDSLLGIAQGHWTSLSQWQRIV